MRFRTRQQLFHVCLQACQFTCEKAGMSRALVAVAGAASIASATFAPTPHVSLAANVLTMTGYTFGGTLWWDMNKILQGAYCSGQSGNDCAEVPYLSGIPGVAEIDGVLALASALSSTAPPTTVVAFSQGATVSTHWIRLAADQASAPAAEDLSFVLVANPWRKYGGSNAFSNPGWATPDSQYSVTDIVIEYDGAADYPDNPFNLLAIANAVAGFQYIHIPGYDDVDLENSEKLTWTEGNTTYVLIRRENIPLLEPLRLIGLDAVADELNGPLKAIIDTAYDRNYPNLVQDATPAGAATQQSSAEETRALAIESPESSAHLSADSAKQPRTAATPQRSGDDISEQLDTEISTALDDSDVQSGTGVDDKAPGEEKQQANTDAPSPRHADIALDGDGGTEITGVAQADGDAANPTMHDGESRSAREHRAEADIAANADSESEGPGGDDSQARVATSQRKATTTNSTKSSLERVASNTASAGESRDEADVS